LWDALGIPAVLRLPYAAKTKGEALGWIELVPMNWSRTLNAAYADALFGGS